MSALTPSYRYRQFPIFVRFVMEGGIGEVRLGMPYGSSAIFLVEVDDEVPSSVFKGVVDSLVARPSRLLTPVVLELQERKALIRLLLAERLRSPIRMAKVLATELGERAGAVQVVVASLKEDDPLQLDGDVWPKSCRDALGMVRTGGYQIFDSYGEFRSALREQEEDDAIAAYDDCSDLYDQIAENGAR